MSEKTKIAWCDSTLNFWEGCAKVSAGCVNCYAEARDKRFAPVNDVLTNEVKAMHWGKSAPRRKSKSAVKDALAYNRKPFICDRCGNAWADPTDKTNCKCGWKSCHRRLIFSLSLGDWLDPEVPTEWLAEMLDTIRQCSDVKWILCTKRPELWNEQMTAVTEHHVDRSDMVDWLSDWRCGKPPKNIILLTSVENQAMADKRIPELLHIPAACRGLSLEPLLGPVAIGLQKNERDQPACKWTAQVPSLDWLIIGGESGPNARPCSVDWIRSLVEQGEAAGVATFVKQLGANVQTSNCAGKMPLKHSKGGDFSEWPSDLRVQQWPRGF